MLDHVYSDRPVRDIVILHDLLCHPVQNRGVGLYIAHLRPGPRALFEKAGIVDMLGEEAFCKDVASAMARIEQVMRERAL